MNRVNAIYALLSGSLGASLPAPSDAAGLLPSAAPVGVAFDRTLARLMPPPGAVEQPQLPEIPPDLQPWAAQLAALPPAPPAPSSARLAVDGGESVSSLVTGAATSPPAAAAPVSTMEGTGVASPDGKGLPPPNPATGQQLPPGQPPLPRLPAMPGAPVAQPQATAAATNAAGSGALATAPGTVAGDLVQSTSVLVASSQSDRTHASEHTSPPSASPERAGLQQPVMAVAARQEAAVAAPGVGRAAAVAAESWGGETRAPAAAAARMDAIHPPERVHNTTAHVAVTEPQQGPVPVPVRAAAAPAMVPAQAADPVAAQPAPPAEPVAAPMPRPAAQAASGDRPPPANPLLDGARTVDATLSEASSAPRRHVPDMLAQAVQSLMRQGMPGAEAGTAAGVLDRRALLEASARLSARREPRSGAAEAVDRLAAPGSEGADATNRQQAPRLQPPAQLPGRDLAALAERIEMLVHRRAGSANVSLTLSGLGDVEVSVRMESRHAHLQFVVHDAAARDALEGALPRLRALLEQGGLSLGDVAMNHSGQSGAGADRQRPEHSARVRGRAGTTPVMPESEPQLHSAPGSDRLLDAFA